MTLLGKRRRVEREPTALRSAAPESVTTPRERTYRLIMGERSCSGHDIVFRIHSPLYESFSFSFLSSSSLATCMHHGWMGGWMGGWKDAWGFLHLLLYTIRTLRTDIQTNVALHHLPPTTTTRRIFRSSSSSSVSHVDRSSSATMQEERKALAFFFLHYRQLFTPVWVDGWIHRYRYTDRSNRSDTSSVE